MFGSVLKVLLAALCVISIVLSPQILALPHKKTLKMILLSDTDNSVYTQSTLALDTLKLIEQYANPRLDINHVIATHDRSWQLLKTIPNACLLNFIKTPQRQKKADFGKYPLTFYPPVRFITRVNHQFSSPFSFEQLTEQHYRRISVVKGRFYTPLLDQKIIDYRRFLLNRGTTNATHKLVAMLAKNRIDGFIEYPREVQDYMTSKQLTFAVTALPIDGVDQPVTGYIACAKTSQGSAILAAIEHAYLDQAMRSQFISAHRQYFGEIEAKLLTPLIKSTLSSIKPSLP